MLLATCHCGSVSIELARPPTDVTDCNCSICRRYGVLWAYFAPEEVRISTPQGTDTYQWGHRSLFFHRCRTCGCVSHWSPDAARRPAGRMGINARLLPLEDLQRLRVRRLDGAVTERYLDD